MYLWIFHALLSAIFASLVAIFGKLGLKDVDSTLATTIRAIIMAIFLVIVSLTLGKAKSLATLNNQALTFITLSGIAGALSWLLYFTALKYGPTSAVAALDRLSLVFVFIFSVLVLSEQFTYKSAFGALCMAVGAILMSIK